MQTHGGVGFRPGLGRQFMLVCQAASGSGLKTRRPRRAGLEFSGPL